MIMKLQTNKLTAPFGMAVLGSNEVEIALTKKIWDWYPGFTAGNATELPWQWRVQHDYAAQKIIDYVNRNTSFSEARTGETTQGCRSPAACVVLTVRNVSLAERLHTCLESMHVAALGH